MAKVKIPAGCMQLVLFTKRMGQDVVFIQTQRERERLKLMHKTYCLSNIYNPNNT